MEEKFKELCDQMNQCKNTKDLYKIIDDWKVDPTELNDWIDVILKNIYQIIPQTLPYVIECLYAQPNKIKFFFAVMLLEETYNTIPFITNLEQIKIDRECYKILLPTLVKLVQISYDRIADCMFLILLNEDPEGSLCTEEQRNGICKGIEEKLNLIYETLKNDKSFSEEVYVSLEIILDVTSYFINDNIKEILEKIANLDNLDSMVKIFLIKTCLINDIKFNKEYIYDVIKEETFTAKFYGVLKKIGKESVFPNEFFNQEVFAKAHMLDWLCYPTELGKKPISINFLDKFEKNNQMFYIYEFETDNEKFSSNGKMLGIAGGYPINCIGFDHSGYTFSKFETVKEDYKSQAIEIVDFISSYFKQRANNN